MLKGGAPISLLYTCEGLKSEGFDVSIGFVRNDQELYDFFGSKGFETYNMSWIKPYFYLSASPQRWNMRHTYTNIIRQVVGYSKRQRKTKKFLSDHKFDIVHLNSVVLINTARVLLGMKQKFVWHVREYSTEKKDFRNRIFKNMLLRANETIFLSKAEKKSWIGDSEKGVVVHNFVDMEAFNPSAVNEQINNVPEFQILFVGGLNKHKGIDILLKLIKKLKSKGYKIKCLMPGTLNSPKTEYFDRIKKYGIQEECELMEFMSDIRHLYKSCDVLVFPATVPHFARPVIEAGAMMKPCIVSDLEPMSELVIPNVTGQLAKPFDVNDWVEKIEYLIRNEHIAEEMGKNARQYAIKNFNKTDKIKMIANIYENILSE